jgi:hypothetical protein
MTIASYQKNKLLYDDYKTHSMLLTLLASCAMNNRMVV